METELVGLFARTREAQNLVCNSNGAVCNLVKDPMNPHDPNAIKVMIGDKHIGFIGRHANTRCRDYNTCVLHVVNYYKGEPTCTLKSFA